MVWEPYSQHFIFFMTYEWTQKAFVFVPRKPLKPNVIEHSSLLGSFINYKENDTRGYIDNTSFSL